jgi:histone-lysine N-methyltransferase MLL3
LEEDLKKLQEKKFSLKQSIRQIEPMDVDSIEMDLECRIKIEKNEYESQHSRDSFSDEKRPKKHPASEEPSNDCLEPQPPSKVWKGLRYKTWMNGAIQPTTKYKKPTDREITEVHFIITH